MAFLRIKTTKQKRKESKEKDKKPRRVSIYSLEQRATIVVSHHRYNTNVR